MKKIILAIAVMFSMAFAASAQKFGIVSAEDIIPSMPEYTDMQNRIAEASKMYEDEFQKIQEELEKRYSEYQELEKDASALQSIKERRIQEIQELDRKAQQFAQTAQQELQRQQMQLMQPLQEKFIQALKNVGAAGGFTMIFPTEVPIYVDSATVIDVTALVKTELGIK